MWEPDGRPQARRRGWSRRVRSGGLDAGDGDGQLVEAPRSTWEGTVANVALAASGSF